ncbi:MAG: single-stranded DNA-binding protein, partial [Clostridia bacterium]|nr:single-stranded DNA-binding protein [Clostridia bacterium]
VNRKYNKSDYIPCISWGKNAQYTSKLGVGSSLVITGRIQSREYIKRDDGGDTTKQCIAYEVSVSTVGEISKDEDAV